MEQHDRQSILLRLASFHNAPYRQSQQPNMLAYGRFFFKSLTIHFLFKRKAHPPRRTLSLALSLEPSCLIDF